MDKRAGIYLKSQQWVAAIAKKAKWDYAVANKQRFGDAEVSISLPVAWHKITLPKRFWCMVMKTQ